MHRQEAPTPDGQALPGRFWATGRCVRARTLPLSPQFFSDAGLGGISRSSGGRAAPLMRERFPGTISTCTDRGKRPPRTGGRCRVALGDRAVRASTHPTAEPARFFLRRRAERDKPIFRWRSGPAHVETSPRNRLSPSQQRAAPDPAGEKRLPRAGQALPGGFGPPGGAGGIVPSRQGHRPLPT